MKRKLNADEDLPSVLTEKSSSSRRKIEVIESEPSISHKSNTGDDVKPLESPSNPIENSDFESNSDDSDDLSKDSEDNSEDVDQDEDQEDVSNPG